MTVDLTLRVRNHHAERDVYDNEVPPVVEAPAEKSKKPNPTAHLKTVPESREMRDRMRAEAFQFAKNIDRSKQLTKPASVRRAFARLPVLEPHELAALVDMLDFEGPLDENLRQDIAGYLREFYRALNDPASAAEWVRELFPTGEPMRSLRDVEQQAPVFSRGGRS